MNINNDDNYRLWILIIHNYLLKYRDHKYTL
jgi:hypothetical protein